MHTPAKTPDPSHEAPRAASKGEPPARFEEPGPHRSAEREDAEFRPKYLSLPKRRSRGHGTRNLAWGVALLGLSALLFAWALYLAGPGAAYTVAGALATAAALYVIARSRILRQRNGSFLAAAIVCLLGVFLVLVQQAWLAAVRTAIAVPVEPARSSAAAAGPASVPALWDEVRPSAAELESGATAKIVHEFKIEIEGKPYRLRAGDVFPVAGTGTGEVRLAAGAQEVAVPSSAVEVTTPKNAPSPRRATAMADPAESGEPFKASPNDTPAVITQKAQAEATRRYPALGVKDSPENKSFLEAYQELKYAGGGSFFDDPEWPLRLAEMLAAREGWGSSRKPGAAPTGGRPPLPAADADSEPEPPRPARAPGAGAPAENPSGSDTTSEPRRR